MLPNAFWWKVSSTWLLISARISAVLITLTSVTTVMASEVEPFKNGYVITHMTPDEAAVYLAKLNTGTLQVIGVTSRYTPEYGDIKGGNFTNELSTLIKQLLFNATSKIGENDCGSLIISEDQSTLLYLFRAK